MLILSRADVEALLEPRALIDALAHGFAEYAAGRAHVPPRAVVPVSDDGVLLVVPGRTGVPLAFMDAGFLTGLRTGATWPASSRTS